MDVSLEPIAFVSHVSCIAVFALFRKHLSFFSCRGGVHPPWSSDRARSKGLRAPRRGFVPLHCGAHGRRLHRTHGHGVSWVRLGRFVSWAHLWDGVDVWTCAAEDGWARVRRDHVWNEETWDEQGEGTNTPLPTAPGSAEDRGTSSKARGFGR